MITYFQCKCLYIFIIYGIAQYSSSSDCHFEFCQWKRNYFLNPFPMLRDFLHLLVDRRIEILLSALFTDLGRHVFNINCFAFKPKAGKYTLIFHLSFTNLTKFIFH